MATHKSTQSVRNERHTADTDTMSMESLLGNIDLKELGAKALIGYAYIITGIWASWHVGVVLALMTSIVWLQYVILFIAAALCMIGVAYTTGHVVDATYNGTMFVARGVGRIFGKAKDAVTSFRTPAEATVH